MIKAATNKLFAVLCCCALCLGLIPVQVFAPTQAFAEDEATLHALEMGTDAISLGDSVYFGANLYDPLGDNPGQQGSWQVIRKNGSGGSYSDGTNAVDANSALFLFYRSGMKQLWFDDNNNNDYKVSKLRAYLNNENVKVNEEQMSGYVSDYFTDAEWASMLETTKGGASVRYSFRWYSDSGLEGDKLFVFSMQELMDYYGYVDGWEPPADAGLPYFDKNWNWYWTRSASNHYKNYPAVIDHTGDVYWTVDMGRSDMWARPGVNLNMNSILFVSNPTNDSSSSEMGNLSSIPAYAGGAWKLTLLDSAHSGFAASIKGHSSASVVAGENIEVSYVNAKTGDNEYVTAVLCDSNGDALYYGTLAQNSEKGKASLTLPSDLPAGKYTLKVFSEQRNGNYKNDYASELEDISLTVPFIQQATPQATFNATDENSGILSNVEPGMKYSTDGGKTWSDVESTSVNLSDVMADNDIKVYKAGNNITTLDSEIQIIDVTKAEAPSSVRGVGCNTWKQDDGQLRNVDNTMEYKLSTDSEWTAITGTAAEGLSPGTYVVRVKGNGAMLASAAVSVIVDNHRCAGRGEWVADEKTHWLYCACGAKVNEGNHIWVDGKCTVCPYVHEHTGGEATCTSPAICEICGSSYGALNPSNHKPADVWTQTDGKHYRLCEYGCGKHFDEETCSGGEATCTAPANCEVCGYPYGDKNAANHSGEIKWTQTATTHSGVYECCGASTTEEPHQWKNGVCIKCAYECQHTGGTATCTEKAICTECGEEYGEVDASNHSNLVKTEAKPATHLEEGNIEYWYCDDCEKYYSDEAGTNEIPADSVVVQKLEGHTFTVKSTDDKYLCSEATCLSPATYYYSCECGEKGTAVFEFGEKDPANHASQNEVWKTTQQTHTKVYECCNAVIPETEGHVWQDGKCSVCGYGCIHTGGTATCSQQAVCENCNALYGDLDPDNHKASDEWSQENGKHYHKCEYGCDTHLDEEDCSGGVATCTNPATCDTCKHPYGELNPNNHTDSPSWNHTLTSHTSVYTCCGASATSEEPHEWENGVCKVCGYVCNHINAEDDGDCSTAVVCPTCGEVAIEAVAEHDFSGGYLYDSDNHWKMCLNGECEVLTAPEAHTFEWATDKEPTATEVGSKHEECTVCGYAKDSVEIPATGSSESPTNPEDEDGSNNPAGEKGSSEQSGKGSDTTKQSKSDATPQTGDNALVFGVPMAVTAVTALIVAAIAFRATRKQGKHVK